MSVLHSNVGIPERRELSQSAALRQAWYWYVSLLFVPFLMFVAVVSYLNYTDAPVHPALQTRWFIASIAFMILAGPAAFAIRSRLFRSYWRGKGVNPRAYLRGMLVIWGTFEIGGLLSLVGCIASNSLLPCLLPAIAAFMFFTPMWPNGEAMNRPSGNSDDPEIYHEPR